MKTFLGIDIGGTSIKVVSTDEEGHVLAADSCLTLAEQDCASAVERVSQLAEKMAPSCQWSAVGLGCTGPIDIVTGIVTNPYTLPGWNGAHLVDLLSHRFNRPVYADNDANAAHLGALMHSRSGSPNSVLLTFGTGVGVSVRMGGSFFRLPDGGHPEMGHLRISVFSDHLCYCGAYNCLENILSGTAINRAVQEHGWQSPEHMMEEGPNNLCTTLLHRWRNALLEGVINLAVTFHPCVVFLAGGLQNWIATHLLRPVQHALEKILPLYGGTVLVPAPTAENSGALGAAWLAILRSREIPSSKHANKESP